MKRQHFPQSRLFKGIALFTPGGDLAYCIDSDKKKQWHLQLCTLLQEALHLTEPPHFLSPCYTATVDLWIDARTQNLIVSAEASPLVLRHQALLNAIFGTESLVWKPLSLPTEMCNPLFLHHFRQQFPQLWENHDLILPFGTSFRPQGSGRPLTDELLWAQSQHSDEKQGYVLRLFISGHGAGNEVILQRLHSILEASLDQPYTLKIVDIQKNPELAEANQISATPTLVKVWPPPIKRLVGNFQDANLLLGLLL